MKLHAPGDTHSHLPDGPFPASRSLEMFSPEILRSLGRDPRGYPLPPTYACVHLERLALGTSYVGVVTYVEQLLNRPELRGQARLVLDATGVGKPVRDMFVARGLKPIPITIHGGDGVTRDGPGFRVPKRDLVQAVQVLLQERRLRFATALPMAPALVEEMQSYQVALSEAGHDTYNARSGQHDDLILSVACAAWLAERWAGVRAPSVNRRYPIMKRH